MAQKEDISLEKQLADAKKSNSNSSSLKKILWMIRSK